MSSGTSSKPKDHQPANEEGSGRGEDASQLDFCSPNFDAALALATPGLQPPDASAQPLDYVAKCRVLLPPDMPESLANAARQSGTKTGAEVRPRNGSGRHPLCIGHVYV